MMEIKEKDIVIDIEGQKGIEEVKGNTDSGGNKRPNKSLIKFTSGKMGYNGSINEGNISSNPTYSGQNNIEVMIDKTTRETQNEESVAYVENTQRKEKRKVKNSNKPTKPPLPPNTPTPINASGLKRPKEIHDIREKRRAKMTRLRGTNKKRGEKPGSFALTMTAMIVSIVFFAILILEGFKSESTQYTTMDEPSQSIPEQKSFISVKFPNLASTENVELKSITSSLAQRLLQGFSSLDRMKLVDQTAI